MLDLFLKGGQDPKGMVLGPLSQELKKPDVFVEALPIWFRTQELRQLIHRQKDAFGMQLGGFAPDHSSVRGLRLKTDLLSHNRFQAF